MFFNIQIALIILKTYNQQFTLLFCAQQAIEEISNIYFNNQKIIAYHL